MIRIRTKMSRNPNTVNNYGNDGGAYHMLDLKKKGLALEIIIALLQQ